jgi:AcrR family transcriptional regulator
MHVLDQDVIVMSTPLFAVQHDGPSPARPTHNKVGRPRAFQDEDVYRVMTNVIAEVGYSGLTFALIAAQIKCTTSALIRRFGDKRSLVQGFILWLAGLQEEAFQEYRDKQVSPLNTLRGRWLIPAQTESGIRELTERPELFLSFFIEARSDPAYRPQLAKLTEQFESELATVISDAVKAGELVDVDAPELAHTLDSAMIGAMSLWLDQPRHPFRKEMERTFDAIVSPYLARKKSH